ncbi:MAG: hypothetical protein Q8R29_00815 [bacterium]|nr:hypothetical protein [bacterium]
MKYPAPELGGKSLGGPNLGGVIPLTMMSYHMFEILSVLLLCLGIVAILYVISVVYEHRKSKKGEHKNV